MTNKAGGQGRRASRIGRHQITPLHFFSAPSRECAEMFVDGHFYGCISLVQSVAEGITRFMARRNGIPFKKNIFQLTLVHKLREANYLSDDAVRRFREIRGKDRDDFHHLNSTIEQDFFELEKRAEECVNARFAIASEVFGYDFDNGALAAKFPQYWLQEDQLPARVRQAPAALTS